MQIGFGLLHLADPPGGVAFLHLPDPGPGQFRKRAVGIAAQEILIAGDGVLRSGKLPIGLQALVRIADRPFVRRLVRCLFAGRQRRRARDIALDRQ